MDEKNINDNDNLLNKDDTANNSTPDSNTENSEEDNKADYIQNEEAEYSEDDKILFEVSTSSQHNEEIVNESKVSEEIVETKKEATTKKKKKKKKSRGAFGAIIAIVLVLAISSLIALTVIVLFREFTGIEGSDETRLIEIPEGANSTQIADLLKESNIIDYPQVFVIYCKLQNVGGKFYPGVHELSDNMSYGSLVKELETVVKKKEAIRVTFKEGITLSDAASLLEKNGICKAKDFIFSFNAEKCGFEYEDLVKDSNLRFYKMEGYFFPDTYDFYPNSNAKDVVKIIRKNFDDKVYKTYSAQIKAAGYDFDYVINLASIVQSESGSFADMKKVASVFVNRLKNSGAYPKLESDPTTKYVNNVIKPNIQMNNEEMFKAYDTYKGNGLPPGAISNPGIDAINAVLNPEKTDYYYFCSNINTKECFFAKTLAEHNKNLVKAKLK